MKVCEMCGRIAYYDCAKCGKSVCDSHVEKCSKCGRWFCPRHITRIRGRYVCIKCLFSQVIICVGIVAIILIVGMIFIPSKMEGNLEIPEANLTFDPNTDGKTVGMVLLLNYNYDGNPLKIVDMSFSDKNMLGFFSQESLKETTIEEGSGELKVLEILNIPYEEAQKITGNTGILYWKEGDKEKRRSTEFSFKIEEILYPVILGEPTLSSKEIKENEEFKANIKVTILDKIPPESMPLRLVMKTVTEKLTPEREKELHIGENECSFDFEGFPDDSVTLVFRVVAGDGSETQWGEEKVLEITIKRRDRIGLSKVYITDNDRQIWVSSDKKYKMFFSKEEQEYKHWLTFSINGKGENILVLIYFDVNYTEFEGIRWGQKSLDITMNSWRGEFDGKHRKGVFFIIPELEKPREFCVEFDNPSSEKFDNPFEEVLGVALIKINSTESPLCKAITESTNLEIATSTYDLTCVLVMQGDGYTYCKKHFTIRFEKEEEPPEPTLEPTREPSPPPPPGGGGKSFLLVYVSFFIFMLSYIFLRKGGIL